jgi:5-methylcytosine-specific restriction endonuclease McrA
MPSRTGRYDQRYHSRRWRALRLQILRRDLWRCQIRLDERCRDQATEVDHIESPHPELGDGSFWDPDNLRAACRPCNNGLNNPATARSFREAQREQSPLANPSPRKRWLTVPSDYSRRK